MGHENNQTLIIAYAVFQTRPNEKWAENSFFNYRVHQMYLKASRLETTVLMDGTAELKNFCPMSQYPITKAEATVGSKEHLHWQFQPNSSMQGKSWLKGLCQNNDVVHQQCGDNCTDVIYIHLYSSLMPTSLSCIGLKFSILKNDAVWYNF